MRKSDLWLLREIERLASPADLLAAIRAGVESGTIEGSVRNEVYCDTCGAVTIKGENHIHGRLVTRWYLRIPVSDVGEGGMTCWKECDNCQNQVPYPRALCPICEVLLEEPEEDD